MGTVVTGVTNFKVYWCHPCQTKPSHVNFKPSHLSLIMRANQQQEEEAKIETISSQPTPSTTGSEIETMAAVTGRNIISINALPGCGRGPRSTIQNTNLSRYFCFKRKLSGTQPLGLRHLFQPRVISSSRVEGFLPSSENSSPITYVTPEADISPDGYAAADSSPAHTQVTIEVLKNTWRAFCRFSRPYSVIGTVIGILSVSLLTVQSGSDLSPVFFIELLKALVPAVLMNIYVQGFNQLFDVEIDKINKPYLPLASGEYSMEAGGAIVVLLAFTSLTMGWMIGSAPLLWALWLGFAVGTAYSVDLPLLRWKRIALPAATSILCIRTIAAQLAIYQHIQNFVYKRPAVLTKSLALTLAFTCCFSVVVALCKDIPDVEGDKSFGIQSYSIRFGRERVFWVCIYLLQALYCAGMIVGTVSPFMWSKIVTISAHALFSAILWHRAYSMDLESKAAFTSFYMLVWKLFCAEYMLLPFIR